MFALYLFTIVFVSLCLLIAEPEPTCFNFATDGTYEVQTTLDTLTWITDFVADVPSRPESNTVIASPNTTTVTDTETTAEPEPAKIDALDNRVTEITEVMSKAAILSHIKSHGWWEPCLSRMNKKELAQVMATREKL